MLRKQQRAIRAKENFFMDEPVRTFEHHLHHSEAVGLVDISLKEHPAVSMALMEGWDPIRQIKTPPRGMRFR
jgi:hypothetical protein